MDFELEAFTNNDNNDDDDDMRQFHISPEGE